MGRCPDCNTFNSLKEHKIAADSGAKEPRPVGDRSTAVLIDEVEAIWEAIDRDDDWSRFDAKIDAIRRMGEALSA